MTTQILSIILLGILLVAMILIIILLHWAMGVDKKIDDLQSKNK